MRIALIAKGREDATTSVLVRETKAGESYLQEDSVRRAAKKLGCKVGEVRLHPAVGDAVGTARFNVISNWKSHYPLFGVITCHDFALREGKEVA